MASLPGAPQSSVAAPSPGQATPSQITCKVRVVQRVDSAGFKPLTFSVKRDAELQKMLTIARSRMANAEYVFFYGDKRISGHETPSMLNMPSKATFVAVLK